MNVFQLRKYSPASEILKVIKGLGIFLQFLAHKFKCSAKSSVSYFSKIVFSFNIGQIKTISGYQKFTISSLYGSVYSLILHSISPRAPSL